jgi:riboflavin synthase
MFTGIIQTMGEVVRRDGLRLEIAGSVRLGIGDSVAVNGVCLTVVGRRGWGRVRRFAFDLSQETLDKTNLGGLAPGSAVNLEPSLRAGDSLGGHFVQGHVDGTGRVLSRTPQGDWTLFEFSVPAGYGRYVAPKGSVAVDGISLTAAEARPASFTVAVIPHTERVTTLGRARAGDLVNIEVDMMAKHVEKILAAWRTPA